MAFIKREPSVTCLKTSTIILKDYGSTTPIATMSHSTEEADRGPTRPRQQPDNYA